MTADERLGEDVAVRDAFVDDAAAVSALLAELGHPLDAAAVERNLERIEILAPAFFALVAIEEGAVVGVISAFATPMLHREDLAGRISVLVVSGAHAGRGVGTLLLRAAEARLIALGCSRVEVTSAAHRMGAHQFYARVGYRQQGVRFVREMQPER